MRIPMQVQAVDRDSIDVVVGDGSPGVEPSISFGGWDPCSLLSEPAKSICKGIL